MFFDDRLDNIIKRLKDLSKYTPTQNDDNIYGNIIDELCKAVYLLQQEVDTLKNEIKELKTPEK